MKKYIVTDSNFNRHYHTDMIGRIINEGEPLRPYMQVQVLDTDTTLCPDPDCKKEIDPKTHFKDDLSLQEYRISGLCQECQDALYD
jgi:hypothetical protein